VLREAIASVKQIKNAGKEGRREGEKEGGRILKHLLEVKQKISL
jgi:hypothetical protein